jgi:hypothetical protein
LRNPCFAAGNGGLIPPREGAMAPPASLDSNLTALNYEHDHIVPEKPPAVNRRMPGAT